jgi:hypothetical protein
VGCKNIYLIKKNKKMQGKVKYHTASKKIALSALVVMIASATMAQAKIVKYFQKLSKENKHHYGIAYASGKYKVQADTECSIIVDEKNGYLQIFDNGTGGGNFVLELAIFKTETNKEILAVNTYAYSGDGRESGSISFFDVADKMADITMSVWPDMGYVEDLLHNGVTKADIEAYADTEYTYSVLPRAGITITMHLGYKRLDFACNDEKDKKACALQKKITPSKLVWNRKTASFNLQ